MPAITNLYLGFDPGGASGGNRFGWSICREVDGWLEPPDKTGLAKEAWYALNQVKSAIPSFGDPNSLRVLAAGIDAPLFWTRTAIRTIDGRIKLALQDTGFCPKKLPNTPAAINSLYGAVSVQGPLLAKHLNDTWPCLTITECYPRALEHLLARTGEHQEDHQMLMRLTDGMNADTGENHERDATLAAISAWAAIRQDTTRWRDLYRLEPNPITPFDLPVSYWMPIPR